MNQQEIFNGLWTITKKKYDACKTDVESVGKDHPTERGVLQLKAGIYNVALSAGFACGAESAMELMGKRFRNLIRFFPDLTSYYEKLPLNEKGNMEIALFPELFMRFNFYDTYHTELAQAEKAGDSQRLFKARIKKEVLDEILEMWRDFRIQNNLFIFAFKNEEV